MLNTFHFSGHFMPSRLIAFIFASLLSTLAFAQPTVQINTNKGAIVVELNSEKAPKTVANFLEYVKSGFYSGTIFHRVIRNFMIQGGGLTKDMQEKPTHAPIKNEADNGLANEVGTIAMARTNDPHSATAQFFINVANNIQLNHRSKDEQGWGYTVFGKVTQGMDVVNKIAKSPTWPGDVPTEAIVIESIILK
jgi:cyclophilin family peptidyl-prolyl cis-trans isomerase